MVHFAIKFVTELTATDTAATVCEVDLFLAKSPRDVSLVPRPLPTTLPLADKTTLIRVATVVASLGILFPDLGLERHCF